MWYCRHEIQFRQALFFSAASVAGAFSGILAFAIGKMDGVGGLRGWRWIFILEGIATVVVAIAAFFVLQDFPETATFLTEEERAFVIHRLKYQGQVRDSTGVAHVAQAEEFKWKYVRQALVDWQVWASIFVYWGVSGTFLAAGSFVLLQVISPDCLPSLRNQSLSSDDYRQPRIYFELCSADDGAHIRHCCRPRSYIRLHL